MIYVRYPLTVIVFFSGRTRISLEDFRLPSVATSGRSAGDLVEGMVKAVFAVGPVRR